MEIHHFLRSRRSVRKFRDDSIPPEILSRLIETAVMAPSAHHRQPWRFVILQNKEVIRKLVVAMEPEFRRDLAGDSLSSDQIEQRIGRTQARITGAAAVILLCFDPRDMDIYPDDRRAHAEWMMGVQSVALAGGTLLLAAHAEGLGAAWVCAPLFAPEAVRCSLNLPQHWEPQGLILLGYPAENPEPRPRRDMEEVVRIL